MFLLIHLLVTFPLLLGSFLAGCCRSRSMARGWMIAALVMPTLFWGGMVCVSLAWAYWKTAGISAVILALCYGAAFVIRFVVHHIKRALTEPYNVRDARHTPDDDGGCGDAGCGDAGDADGGD